MFFAICKNKKDSRISYKSYEQKKTNLRLNLRPSLNQLLFHKRIHLAKVKAKCSSFFLISIIIRRKPENLVHFLHLLLHLLSSPVPFWPGYIWFFHIYILNYGIAFELHTDEDDKMPTKICVAGLC